MNLAVIAARLHSDHQFTAEEGKTGAFLGSLAFRNGQVHVRLELVDCDVIAAPKIHILEGPDELSFGSPNIGFDRDICYTSPDDSYLDRARAPEAVSECVHLAQRTLLEIECGQGVLNAPEEFPAYWGGVKKIITINLDDPPNEVVIARIAEPAGKGARDKNDLGYAIGATAAQIQSCLPAKVVFDVTENCHIAILHIQNNLVPCHPWPIESVSMLCDWLGKQEFTASIALQNEIAKAHAAGKKSVAVLFRPNVGAFGVIVNLSYRQKFRDSKLYARAICSGKATQVPIVRTRPELVGQKFIVERNLPEPAMSLAGIHIRLIGLGTIGGWAALFLSRLGAGTGGGCLEIVDDQTFTAGNIGRHVLGIESVDMQKAKAVDEHLKRQNPEIYTYPRNVRAETIAELLDCDLIIDATGKQSFSYWLDEQVEGGAAPPVIYAWIAGNGAIAAAYLRTGQPEEGCYRCLESKSSRHHQHLVPTEETEYRTYGGCDNLYVPYPTNVSVTAASLVVELLLSHRVGQQSFRLVARRFRPDVDIYVANPNRSEDCSACS